MMQCFRFACYCVCVHEPRVISDSIFFSSSSTKIEGPHEHATNRSRKIICIKYQNCRKDKDHRHLDLLPLISSGTKGHNCCTPRDSTSILTCHHSHRFSEPATKSEKRNGKLRLACVHVRHPPSKNPVGDLSWTCRSQKRK